MRFKALKILYPFYSADLSAAVS